MASYICTDMVDITSHLYLYASNKVQLQNEVTTWKVHIGELDLSDDEKKCLLFTCTFAANNNMYYPNIYTILSLLLTLPVGSCSCERSFSSLRRLKTWCRNTTTNERLDALAIGYINKEYSISPNELLKAWDRSDAFL